MQKEFKISTKIYSQQIISQVIADFSEFGDIQFNNGILIIAGENEDEIVEIFNEFINYCIGLINEGH